MTYSSDFRRQLIKVREDEKLSMAEVAKRFGVGLATVMRWTKRIDAKTTRNKPPQKIDMEALQEDVKMYPDSYQHERAERFGMSRMGMWHALKRLRVTYKKNSPTSQG